MDQDDDIIEAHREGLHEYVTHSKCLLCRPRRARFTADGDIVTEEVLAGDRGVQGSLLPTPTQSGEGLATETAGPLFRIGKED